MLKALISIQLIVHFVAFSVCIPIGFFEDQTIFQSLTMQKLAV